MYKHEDTDPRDCRYKIQNNKFRKQIDQILRDSRKKHRIFKSDDKTTTRLDTKTVRNRKQKQYNDEDEEDFHKDFVMPGQFILYKGSFNSSERIKLYIEELETILLSDEHDTFSYNDLMRMHQLFQYLESDLQSENDKIEEAEENEKKVSTKKSIILERFFFEFLENFKVFEQTDRGNSDYQARIRKLKVQNADREYSQMSSSVSKMIGEKNNKNGRFSFQEDIRSIRTTLLATVNAIMVIVAVFFFFYVAIGYSKPDITIANKVLYSFAAAMISAIAEVYFLIRIV